MYFLNPSPHQSYDSCLGLYHPRHNSIHQPFFSVDKIASQLDYTDYIKSPFSTPSAAGHNGIARTPTTAGEATIASGLSPTAWNSILQPGSTVSLLGELETQRQHNQCNLDLQTTRIKDGFGQPYIQLESGSTSTFQLKKNQEGGLLINVRDIVVV